MTRFARAGKCEPRDASGFLAPEVAALAIPDRATDPKPPPSDWRKPRRDDGKSERVQEIMAGGIVTIERRPRQLPCSFNVRRVWDGLWRMYYQSQCDLDHRQSLHSAKFLSVCRDHRITKRQGRRRVEEIRIQDYCPESATVSLLASRISARSDSMSAKSSGESPGRAVNVRSRSRTRTPVGTGDKEAMGFPLRMMRKSSRR